LLNTDKASTDQVKKAIGKANHAIAACRRFEFYADYRNSLIKPVKHSLNAEKLGIVLSAIKTRYPELSKIILHAGTPKTGTTSMQFFLANRHADLKLQGYLYPSNYSDTYEPKHQLLVSALLDNDVNSLIEEFHKILKQLTNGISTIILSTEGIYNHWFDFSQEAKYNLTVIDNYFELNLWVWLREPCHFIESLYCQYLKNQKLPRVACYGQNWTLNEMLNNSWFTKHLDYLGFIYEIDALLGKDKIKIFPHQENNIGVLGEQLNIDYDSNTNSRENIKFCKTTVELLRIINRHSLGQPDRCAVLQHLTKIDSILSSYRHESMIDETTRRLILELSALGLFVLNSEYNIDFPQQ
ncbi:MAG: hypothetical protein ACRESZ_19360, partial [Methylococcales bacterium]